MNELDLEDSPDVEEYDGVDDLPIEEFDPLAVGKEMRTQTVVLELKLHYAGFSKKFNSQEILEKMPEEERPESSVIACYKTLVNTKCKEIKAVNRLYSDFLSWLTAHSLPCKMLRGGMYLISLTLVNEVDYRVTNFKIELAALLQRLKEVYPLLIEEQREKLKEQFNIIDYMTADEVIAAYGIEASYLSFNVPAALAKVNEEIFNREKAKAQLKWADAATEVREGYRAGFNQLVQHFSGKLSIDPITGKRKVLHESAVKNLMEFIQTYTQCDPTNDQELANLAGKARQLLQGIDIKDIRTNEGLRTSLEQGFQSIASQASELIETRERKVMFDIDPTE